jgi:hypothetical protein
MTQRCPHCRAVLPPGAARFCTWCYARLEDLPDGTPTGNEPTPPRRRVGRLLAAILLLWAAALLTGRVALAAARGGSWDAPGSAVGVALAIGGLILLWWEARYARRTGAGQRA